MFNNSGKINLSEKYLDRNIDFQPLLSVIGIYLYLILFGVTEDTEVSV